MMERIIILNIKNIIILVDIKQIGVREEISAC